MRRRNAGFTLIEMVAAMSVVSILAGIAIPAVQDAAEAARSGAAKGTLVESWMTSVAHAANTGRAAGTTELGAVSVAVTR